MEIRRLFSLILISGLTLLGALSAAHADIQLTVTRVPGASNQIPSNFVPGTPLKIFGGFAGDETKGNCDNQNGTNTCNNCEVDTVDPTLFHACNENRAYPQLRLQFTFVSTSLPAGSIQIPPRLELVAQGTTTGGVNVPATSNPTTITGPNQQVTLSVLWRDICEAYGSDDVDASTCGLANQTGTFRLGFDKDNDGSLAGDEVLTITIAVADGEDYDTNVVGAAACAAGICDYNLIPGDEKTTVRNAVIKAPTGPLPAFAVMLCQKDSFADITQLDICQKLPISNGNTLVEDTITNLANGTTYFFHTAIQDEAGNIGHFVKRANANCAAAFPECNQVTPDQVIGLFAEEQNCFIATAAYGSPMEKHVAMLRQFRNRYLLTNGWGHSLVKLYYAVSPPVARWIAQDPDRREVTRAFLAPVVWSVSVFMNWSWTLGIALLFGCCLLAFRRKFYKA